MQEHPATTPQKKPDAPISYNSASTTFTNLPPAALSFLPNDSNRILVGTYFLDAEGTKTKSGELCLYQVAEDNTLNLLETCATLAVYDFKFDPGNAERIVAAHPGGWVSVVEVAEGKIVQIFRQQLVEDESVSVLYATFNHAAPEMVAFSLSDGKILVCKADYKNKTFEVESQYASHTLEAWICEFTRDGSAIYSGGDDSVLNVSNTETGTANWTNRKIHQAGVTSILEMGNDLILTGSYDEHLRVINTATRRVVNEIHLGGGVWRLKWKDECTVLASCMHAGTRLVEVKNCGHELRINAVFEENESMNYASDNHPQRPNRIVSSSFYDKRLCIWIAE